MGRKIASKLKAVLEFHHSIALHGFTAYAVQASSIHIHLNLVHQVYVRLAGQFAASHFIKRHVLVFAGSLVKDGHLPVNAYRLQLAKMKRTSGPTTMSSGRSRRPSRP